MHRYSDRCGESRGSLLVMVLVLLAMATFIVLAFNEDAMERMKYYNSQYERDDLRQYAYSYMEVAIATLSEVREIDDSLHSPAQGWRDPLKYAGIAPPEGLRVSFDVSDEAGKLGLSKLMEDRDLLIMLFEEMDIEFQDGQELADTFLDWTDADQDQRLNGAEADYYEDMDPPYLCADAAMETFEELRLIKYFDVLFFNEDGLPNHNYTQFTSAVSLYNTGGVNTNTASGLVMEVLGRRYGFNPDYIMDYRAGDDGEIGTEDDDYRSGENADMPPEVNPSDVGMSTDVLKLTVKVSGGDGGAFQLSAIISWSAVSSSARNTPLTVVRKRDAQSSRGAVNPALDNAASELNYPVRIMRIIENFDL